MKRKQQRRKIGLLCESIPGSELKCSYFSCSQGRLVMIYTIKMCTKAEVGVQNMSKRKLWDKNCHWKGPPKLL